MLCLILCDTSPPGHGGDTAIFAKTVFLRPDITIARQSGRAIYPWKNKFIVSLHQRQKKTGWQTGSRTDGDTQGRKRADIETEVRAASVLFGPNRASMAQA